MSTYENGIERLIARVAEMDGEWSPTPEKKELKQIEKELLKMVNRLDTKGFTQFDIEQEHNKAPSRYLGENGWMVDPPDYGVSYKATLIYMRDLAASANRVAAALPSSRERFAIPFAAMGLLHLLYWHGMDMPKKYDADPAVLALIEICFKAGKPRSIEVFRNAISEALKSFKTNSYPPGIDRILTGK